MEPQLQTSCNCGAPNCKPSCKPSCKPPLSTILHIREQKKLILSKCSYFSNAPCAIPHRGPLQLGLQLGMQQVCNCFAIGLQLAAGGMSSVSRSQPVEWEDAPTQGRSFESWPRRMLGALRFYSDGRSCRHPNFLLSLLFHCGRCLGLRS